MNEGMDGSFLGLGFSQGVEADLGSTPMVSSSSAVNTTDSLVKHYLQQCLDYHEEQQQHLQKEEATVPQFVAAQHPPPFSPLPTTEESAPTATNDERPAAAAVVVPSQAIAKARAIVQKFQQQYYSSTDVLPADYRYRRQQFLEKEQQRKHSAILKNLAYIARKEEDRLKKQLIQLEQTKRLEEQLHQQHALHLQHRKDQQAGLLQTKAGIGTLQRQKEEKQKHRKGHAVSQELSATIYCSGLPNTASEDIVRNLFGSYGTIRRVILYRHKQTRELKGDALVIYSVKKETAKSEILNAVCMQVSQGYVGDECVKLLRQSDSLRRTATMYCTHKRTNVCWV